MLAATLLNREVPLSFKATLGSHILMSFSMQYFAVIVVLVCVFSMLNSSTTSANSESIPTTLTPSDQPAILASLRSGHPRLLVSPTTWGNLQELRRKNASLDVFLQRNEAEARALLTIPPAAYHKEGRRLLMVSRTVLRRVLLLALHFRLTGDPELARRAEREMLAAAAFIDWNPSHFLDVAEMTAALALGYDWLHDELSADSRNLIATAIIEKGLRPGLVHNTWTELQNNWNQVCLSGLSLGALAIAEDEPELAAQILEMTKTHNHHGLSVYQPEGVYPEGPMYWQYGSSFQAVLLAALESALGTDWGLSKAPGFLESANVLMQETGPTGLMFNFSDGGNDIGPEPTFLWFAQKLGKPEITLAELAKLRHYATQPAPAPPTFSDDRLLPLAALWWPAPPPSTNSTTSAESTSAAPSSTGQLSTLPRFWYGHGPNPIAVFRDAWNKPQVMYLALKGGSASLSHAHMDAGSFIFEAGGVRWAHDLGHQEYHSLESKSIDLWNRKQDSQRWTVFRLNNRSHNTLTIDNQLHRVDGQANITAFSDANDPGAIVDLSSTFRGQASKVMRGFAFRSGSHVLIRDEIEGLQGGSTVRWAMLTKADVGSPGPQAIGSELILQQAGQHLRVHLQLPLDAKFEVIPANPPDDDFNAPNPNAHLLIVNMVAPASGRLNIAVILQPVVQQEQLKSIAEPLAQTELRHWPQPQVP
jgi:hypothetical protein